MTSNSRTTTTTTRSNSKRRNGGTSSWMDHLSNTMEPFVDSIAMETSRYDILEFPQGREAMDSALDVARRRIVIFALLGPILTIWHFGLKLGPESLVAIVGVAFPAWATIATAYRRDMRQHHVTLKLHQIQWLTYWMLYFAMMLMENAFGKPVVQAFPFYWAFKLGFLVFLQSPHTLGALQVWNLVIAPLIGSDVSGGSLKMV